MVKAAPFALTALVLVFTIAIAAPAPARADDLSDCVDRPPTSPVTATRIRDVLLRRIDVGGAPGLRAGVCIDSPSAELTSAKIGVLSSNGELLVVYGQPVNPGINAKQHGETWSYFFNEERKILGYDPARIADRVIVQPYYGEDGITGSYLQRVTISDWPLAPIHRIAPDSCLAPPQPDTPALRDVSVLTNSARRTYTLQACVVAPANARMSLASVTAHVFTKAAPGEQHSPLLEVAQTGNTVIGLQPLAGALPPHRLPHGIAVLGFESSPTGQPMEGTPPVAAAFVERHLSLCRSVPHAPCVPLEVNDLIATPLIDRGTNPE